VPRLAAWANDPHAPSYAAEILEIRQAPDDESGMEKRVAMHLALLRRRRSAVLSLIRSLEEYCNANRPAVSPRRTLRQKRTR
jgi:hypothetical protein